VPFFLEQLLYAMLNWWQSAVFLLLTLLLYFTSLRFWHPMKTGIDYQGNCCLFLACHIYIWNFWAW
jgi:hypothetical protein